MSKRETPESDPERKSLRSNLLEQRLYEIEISGINTAKKTVALEIRNSQTDLKRRLHKYRDRQKEIMKGKSPSFIAGILRPRSEMTLSSRHDTPAKTKSYRKGMTPAATEIVLDPSFFIDQRKSMIDLRPSTARSLTSGASFLDVAVCNDRYSRLGTPEDCVRYFDDDEIKDRGTFYASLIQFRKKEEEAQFENIENKVDDFCNRKHHKFIHSHWKKSSPVGFLATLKMNQAGIQPQQPSSPSKLKPKIGTLIKKQSAFFSSLPKQTSGRTMTPDKRPMRKSTSSLSQSSLKVRWCSSNLQCCHLSRVHTCPVIEWASNIACCMIFTQHHFRFHALSPHLLSTASATVVLSSASLHIPCIRMDVQDNIWTGVF